MDNAEISHSLKRVSFKNKINEIGHILEPYFKSKYQDHEGNSARFLSINDVNIVSLDLHEITQVIANLDIRSDIGEFKQGIIIRQFSSFDTMEAELDRYTDLEARTLLFPFVSILPIIHLDKQQYRVIYEIPVRSHTIDQMNISPRVADYTLGRLSAILQGLDARMLNQTKIRYILELIQDQLPFSDDEKLTIAMMFEPHYPIIDHTKGGYVPLTLFDPTRIFFKLNEDDSDKPVQVFVPILEPDVEVIDRIADVAVVFTERAYNEFQSTRKVDRTKNSIKDFFQGYNSVISKVTDQTLEDFYPHGITLDLQMLLNFCLFEMSTSQTPFTSQIAKDYIYFLLEKKPFLIF